MADMVNHPLHYETGKFECIDVMLETQGKEATQDFCLLNAFKYLYRHRNKNGTEDVRKAKWYIDKYLELEDCNMGNKKKDVSGAFYDKDGNKICDVEDFFNNPIEAIFGDIDTETEEPDDSDFEEIAETTKKMFDAFRKVGFTESQAFQLLNLMLRGGANL